MLVKFITKHKEKGLGSQTTKCIVSPSKATEKLRFKSIAMDFFIIKFFKPLLSDISCLDVIS